MSAPPRGAVRRHVFAALRPHRLALAGAAGAVATATLITVAGPALVGYAIDRGVERGDADALRRAALAFLGLALARPFVERALVVLSARVGERFMGTLRTAAFDRLQALPLAFFEGERAGVLVSRLTADVQSLSTFVRQVFVEVASSLLLLGATVVAILALSPTLTAVCLVTAAPILSAATIRFHRRSPPAYLAVRDRVGETLTALQEGFAGMRVVQASRREPDVLERYRERSWGVVGAWRNAALVNVRFFPAIVLAQILGTAAVLGVGGVLYARGEVSIGVLAAFVLYLASLFDPLARLSEWFGELQSGRAALTKIVGLIETPDALPEREDAVELPAAGALEARGVRFAYEAGKPALDGVDLAVPPGEHLALVGATGAGKSTLAKALARLVDPDAGVVAFAGVDLRDARRGSVRDRIVVLPQEGHLFAGSLADNVRLARPAATDAEVEHALAAVGALARFCAFPDGIATEVQARGVRLSAGERQLVGLARIALAQPAVVILDEATSSLDPSTERAVERALAAVTEGRTLVTIAHRLSTARRADRIAVIAAGRIVQLGAHDELVARDGPYRALWRAWEAGAAEPVAAAGA